MNHTAVSAVAARVGLNGFAETPSPDVVVDALPLRGGIVHVVRDDLLEGGTKQRAIAPYLRSQAALGKTEFVYASPFCGFAQVALAVSAQRLGFRCVLFCERAPGRDAAEAHEFSRLAASHGAEIHLCESLAEADERARSFAKASWARLQVPLGFACPQYRSLLRDALARQWQGITIRGLRPKRLWLPLGSGTLARVFRRLLPASVELSCVDVHVLDENDERVRSIRALPHTRYFSAAETFPMSASRLPPIPSNVHYDAKLWAFLCDHAEDGDVWWNVAR